MRQSSKNRGDQSKHDERDAERDRALVHPQRLLIRRILTQRAEESHHPKAKACHRQRRANPCQRRPIKRKPCPKPRHARALAGKLDARVAAICGFVVQGFTFLPGRLVNFLCPSSAESMNTADEKEHEEVVDRPPSFAEKSN
jgi:hypothetical protein